MEPMFAWWTMGVRATQLMVTAQSLIALRAFGAFGLWPMAASEARRIWMEKPGAFAESAGQAATAMMDLRSPDVIVGAAILPFEQGAGAKRRAGSCE